jgi:chemotaxis protein methyltransferase CheR
MALAAAEFEYLKQFVRQHAAIVLEGGKESLAELRLSPLARQEGMASAQQLLERLRHESFGGLHLRVLDAMTNNETWFFRDLVPFEALQDLVIPALAAARASSRKLNIWSAACSTGQEAYSIAMSLRGHFPQLQDWSISILATDLSLAALQRAERGLYTQLEVNRGLPIRYLAKHFLPQGIDWQLEHEICRMVEFRQMNLAEPWPPLPLFDLILFRNVLIYFDSAKRREIFRRLRRALHPEGYLFLGGPESTCPPEAGFERKTWATAVYYRLAGAVASGSSPEGKQNEPL